MKSGRSWQIQWSRYAVAVAAPGKVPADAKSAVVEAPRFVALPEQWYADSSDSVLRAWFVDSLTAALAILPSW